MGVRERIEDRINKKKNEIEEYKVKILEAESYIQGLQDTLRMLPKNDDNESSETVIRPGSKVYKTLMLLKKVDRPLHITEILKGIGLPTDKKERTSLSGSLGWYVRKKEIFTRPEPNTFGLKNESNDENKKDNDEVPNGFGFSEDDFDEETINLED